MTQKLTTIIPAIFNQIRPGATFMSVIGYENNYKEISNFGIVFHVNYLNAVRKALDIWEWFVPITNIEKLVKLELTTSYRDSLSSINIRAKSAGAYDEIVDGNDQLVKGCKWYRNGAEVHVWGFRVYKKVIKPGIYANRIYVPQTHNEVKYRLMGMTQLSSFRQFKIIEGRFDRIGVEKLTLTHKDLLKELS